MNLFRRRVSAQAKGDDSVAYAAGRDINLHMPANHKPWVGMVQLTHATAKARNASRPRDLPPIDRRSEFGLTEGSLPRTPLVIVGEGGAGKSVVAGDMVDWAALRCLLVPCSRIPANADLSSAGAIDSALGDAASDSREGVRLTEIAGTLPPSTLLVIDTLDLVLTADTADNIDYVLKQLSAMRGLVVTCRDQEWHDLMGATMFPEHRLGQLSVDQICTWVDAYLAANASLDADLKRNFAQSVRVAVRGSGGVVLGSPVRLAMACSLYAAEGALPPGLSVHELYRSYWNRNVTRDRRGRRLTTEADAQEEAALSIATRIWQRTDTVFSLQVPRTGLASGAVQDLLSSGLLKEVGSEQVEFFHQTFAEFAVARMLATTASDTDIARLGDGLANNSPAHWGVSAYLASSEMDGESAVRIASAIPDSNEGLRVRLRLLSTHKTGDALANELARIEALDAGSLRAAFPALTDAIPSCAEVVAGVAIRQLGIRGPDVASVATTFAAILRRLPAPARNDGLKRACEALRFLGGTSRADLYRLLETCIPPGDDTFDVDSLLPLYTSIGAAAQRVVIRSYAGASPKRLADLLEVALTSKCPSESLDEMVELGLRVWQDASCRERLGWADWQAMLNHVYPGNWVGVQIRLASHLAVDEDICRALVLAVIDTSSVIDRRRFTNSLAFVAQHHPDLVCSVILTNPPPSSRAVMGNLSTVIGYLPPLDEPMTAAMYAFGMRLKDLEPRRVLPAMVAFAVRSDARLDDFFRVLLPDGTHPNADIPSPAMDSTWDTLFAALDDEAYLRRRAQVASMVAGGRINDRRRRVKMLGRDALDDPRLWMDAAQMIRDKGQLDAAKMALREIIRFGERRHPSTLKPLVELLDTPHGECARMIAVALTATTQIGWSSSDLSAVTNRLERSCDSPWEDTQLPAALLEILARIARQESAAPFLVDARVVRTVMDAYRRGVDQALAKGDGPRASALSTQWLGTLSKIGVIRLPAEEIGSSIASLVTDLDLGRLGTSVTRDWALLLIGITRNSPAAWQPIGQVWRETSLSNQQVIAKVLVDGRIPGGRDIALERSRDPSCPPKLSKRIHKLLNS